MQSLTKTNVLFRFKKGWPQLFLNWVSCWKLTRKNVLCWGNCCQFGEQFLTDRIFWATFPKHSQNRCFIPSLHKITTVPSLLMPFMKMTPRSHAQQTFSRNVRMNHKAKRIWKKKHILFQSRQLSPDYHWIRTHECYSIYAEYDVCI